MSKPSILASLSSSLSHLSVDLRCIKGVIIIVISTSNLYFGADYLTGGYPVIGERYIKRGDTESGVE